MKHRNPTPIWQAITGRRPQSPSVVRRLTLAFILFGRTR